MVVAHVVILHDLGDEDKHLHGGYPVADALPYPVAERQEGVGGVVLAQLAAPEPAFWEEFLRAGVESAVHGLFSAKYRSSCRHLEEFR